MGTIHFIGGEKGGVGKSFTARLLAQYLVDTHRAMVGFDTDLSHSTFTRFYAQFCESLNVADFESLDSIVETANENSDQHLVVDLAAQTAAKLNDWLTDCDFFSLMAELNYKVFYWHVMDDSADCVRLLDKLLSRFDHENVQVVVVQNFGRGANFLPFEHTAVFEQVKRQNGHIVKLPALHAALAQKIDFNNYSFWAAAHSRHVMKITELQRTKTWLKQAYEQIDPLFVSIPEQESEPA